MAEAVGVELFRALETSKLLILQTDKKDKTDKPPISACNLHTKFDLKRSKQFYTEWVYEQDRIGPAGLSTDASDGFLHLD